MPANYDNPDFDMVPRQEPDRPRWAWWTRRRLIALVTIIGLLLRLWAAWQLPIDADEPVYLTAAHDYAVLIDQGDLQGVIDYRENSEHPPLSKLLYSGVLLVMGNEPAMDRALFSARLVSVFFGTLTVFVIALIDPLAGLFAAVQTLMVKYTSEVYLEALPQFACLLALYAMLKSKRAGERGLDLQPEARSDLWFWISAGGLGLAAAGKFSYFPILIPVLLISVWEKRASWQKLALYIASAAVIFLALDPALWRDPFDRLISALSYHVDYSQSQHVQTSGYNWYQPFFWVLRSWGYTWHSNVFFYYGIDALIALLGLAGAALEWNKRRWLAVWLAASMLFLVLWPTRWPQYTLVVLPAFCLAAATAYRAAAAWVRIQENTWGWFHAMIPHPTKAVRIGLLVGGILFTAIYLGYWAWLGIQRMGWSHLTSETSPLPSNTVYDLLSMPDGRMVIATAAGAAIWSPPREDELVYTWELITRQEIGQRPRAVLTTALSPTGDLWFGTQTGIEIYDPAAREWRSVVLPAPMQVNDIVFGPYDTVWAATSLGGLTGTEESLQLFGAGDTPLEDYLFSVAALEPSGGSPVVWFGGKQQIVRYDGSGWHTFGSSETGLGPGGVSDLMVDSSGVLWASSFGGGIARWDGSSWRSYRLDNSNLPGSIIQDLYEYPEGKIWASIAFPNTAGGVIAYLDGDSWKVVRSNTSGYSGSETLSMAADAEGRLWFGTITAGVDIWVEKR